jgi:uncharacterized protein (DUF1810 family)
MEPAADDPYRLARFVGAQDRAGTYPQALAELRRGRKSGHWMWFVFPQIRGLGQSATSREFALSGLPEAGAYLDHQILGPRLIECARLVADIKDKGAVDIFGPVDAMKLHSSMTLFALAAPEVPVFRVVLNSYFDGLDDEQTIQRL